MQNNDLIQPVSVISVGITHVSGKLLFKDHSSKWARAFYSICHKGESIYALFPEDYLDPIMVTTILVDIPLKYCDKSKFCLDFKCDLSRFNREEYIKQFGNMGGFTLGLPSDFGSKPLWFNEGKWRGVWSKFIIPIDGGTLKYDENKDKGNIIT